MINENEDIDSLFFNEYNNFDFENNIESHLTSQKYNLSENQIFKEDFLNKKIKTNSFETNSISLNEDEIKRKNKLKKNAESAKRARQRKKELMNNLIQENIKLKSEIKELKKILENKICDKCKSKVFHSKIEINNNNNNIFNKKKIFFFSTMTLSFILLIFFILNISINQKTSNSIRNLNFISNELSNYKYADLEIQNLTLASMHILFGDYYSLIKNNYKFLYNENNIIYSFQNKGKVRILKENEITEDLNIENCKDCIVELNQDDVVVKKSKSGIFSFKIILTPKKINIDGNDFDINSGKNGLPIISYEIDCSSFGFSKNLIYNYDYN